MQQLKYEEASSYTMQVKRADCMGSVIHSLFGFTCVSIPVILNQNWYFLILTSVLWGWAAIIKLGEAVAKFKWKVIVKGKQFTVYGFLKNGQSYYFSDNCYVKETIKFVNQNIAKFYRTPVYEVMVGESPALRSTALSIFDRVIGCNVFIQKNEIYGKN